MTYRITIRRGGVRFSYYGYFPDSVAATASALSVANPGDGIHVKQLGDES